MHSHKSIGMSSLEYINTVRRFRFACILQNYYITAIRLFLRVQIASSKHSERRENVQNLSKPLTAFQLNVSTANSNSAVPLFFR